MVLVFTDGVDRPMNFSTHNVSLKDVMKRAEEEDVMVYAIGLAEPRAVWRRPRGGGTAARRMRRVRRRALRPLDGRRSPTRGCAKIALETGGGYFELTTPTIFESTFARVADELHRQYALGFVPAKLDGKTHSLEVRLKRAGLTARARKSYVAAADRAPTE